LIWQTYKAGGCSLISAVLESSLEFLLNLDTLQQQSQVSVIGMGGVLASVLLVYLLPSYQLAGDVPLAALLTL